jgi:CarD family transcriptional regulator
MKSKMKELGMEKGDWIVHPRHGIGQIRRLEEKTVDGENQPYIRVEGPKYDWWIAVETVDEKPIRPLRKPSTFKRALRLLKKDAKELPQEAKQRRRHIMDVLSTGSPAALCRVVRDLSAMSKTRQLPEEDKRILRKYQNALLDEWSLTLDIPKGEAEDLLEEYLDAGYKEETD